MKIRNLPTNLAIFISIFSIAMLAGADDHWSDDWKISTSGRSSSNGALNFSLTFEPGKDGTAADPITIEVLIADNTRDNDIAELISNNFRGKLGEDDFKIDTSWGEHVKVKARGDTPDFVVELSGNTVQGISLEIK